MLKLNMTEVSNKEVSACQSNPCEPKAQASDCSKHTVSDSKSPFRLSCLDYLDYGLSTLNLCRNRDITQKNRHQSSNVTLG